MSRVGVLGAGAWGTALAQMLASDGREVLLWARELELVTEINTAHTNSLFLPSAILADTIRATGDTAEMAQCDVLLVVTPAQHLGAVLGTIIAAMCGYALSKYEFRGRELIFNVVLSGVLVPATALALPLFLIFSEVNLTNTYWAVFLPSLVSPFGVYLARIYAAASVPGELLEAARLDGSGEVRTFFTVSSRLMAPALVTIFLFQFVAIWNNFFLPLIMLRDQALFPVTLGLYAWNSQISQIPELRTFVIIGALVSILPLIIAFLGLQRFWSSGLGAGSVK